MDSVTRVQILDKAVCVPLHANSLGGGKYVSFNHEQDMTQSQLRRCMYLPNPTTMSRVWHRINFKEDYVFIQPLNHEQDVTQGQFLRGVCIYPTHPLWAGCYTRSISKTGMHLPNPSTVSKMWHKVDFLSKEEKRWIHANDIRLRFEYDRQFYFLQ